MTPGCSAPCESRLEMLFEVWAEYSYNLTHYNMGVSLNAGIPKLPQNDHF